MDKAPDAFRTISEVADDLDVPQHVLRFWETRFTQIKPMKRSGGRRYYRPDDVNLLRGIRRLLYGEGYTIRGVQRILREHGIKAVQGLTDVSADHAAALFDGPSFENDKDASALNGAEYDADGEGEGEETFEEAEADEERDAPLSLRDLGPPLTDAPPLKAVVRRRPRAGHFRLRRLDQRSGWRRSASSMAAVRRAFGRDAQRCARERRRARLADRHHSSWR